MPHIPELCYPSHGFHATLSSHFCMGDGLVLSEPVCLQLVDGRGRLLVWLGTRTPVYKIRSCVYRRHALQYGEARWHSQMLRFPPVTRRSKTNRREIMAEDSHRTLAGVVEKKGTKHAEETRMGYSMRRANSCPKAVCSQFY